MADQFTVSVEGFEGPLDLLLSLIEKRKLPINDVSLAAVTDEYIAHSKRQSEYPLSQTAHFILIASALLLIKSKSLLPNLELTDEEEESVETLQKRLCLYREIKELSVHVKERFGTRILFEPQRSSISEPVFSPAGDLSLSLVAEAVHRVMAQLPKIELVPEAIVKRVVSLEETIGALTERISRSLRMRFSEFSNVQKSDKGDVIVSFLAMLELVKQGIISVMQEKTFADITMETDAVSVPKYE